MHPADLHVHPDHWIRPMYCLRLVCHMKIAHGSLRLTLNEEIEKEDIDYVVDKSEKKIVCTF